MIFQHVLTKFRNDSKTEKEKGSQFERLMQLYLQTEPYYTQVLKKIWLWNEFPFRNEFGGKDLGIDLVAQTTNGGYWAIQCKCYDESVRITKAEVDTFLSTASRFFVDDQGKTNQFERCLWISTTNNWGTNAEETIRNHVPAVSRLSLHHLQNSSVEWEKLLDGMSGEAARKPRHQPRPHQQDAITAATSHYKTADRGKLIMACGTGKTFTSLKIAEKQAGDNGLVLFLVPSIALLGQTLEEWLANAERPINPICICSDPEVSKRKTKNEDFDADSVVDLALPASTQTPEIIKQLELARANTGITVVFSTYQSIEVIAKAQQEYRKQYGEQAGIFDLIVCDEAHRTTGVTLSDKDESAFVKVHDNNFLTTKKRMYMTATPRLYHDDAKKKAADNNMILCSMDDESLYGKEFYHIGFGDAVEKDLLSDYKVLILTVNENDLSKAAQLMIAAGENEIPAEDVNKLIGCINALSKEILGDQTVKASDPEPMCTAVAFCQNIKISKAITKTFNQMRELYYTTLPVEQQQKMVVVDSKHIDGTMAATERGEKLMWLKNVPKSEMKCRILTNVRCLSEGVDVPSLDAVMFLSARNSQVDVVQSVGRVMRRSPGKKYGYIIIPIVVPYDVEGEKALSNSKEYGVVWTVLNALRAHDDRFNATINKIELNKAKPESIVIGGASHGRDDHGGTETVGGDDTLTQLTLKFKEMQSLLYAKLVEKVGERRYWEQWAKDVAAIATRQIEGIRELVEKDKKHKSSFEKFMKGLRKNINPSISENDAIEMLAQHLITQPVFEALFENYSFVKNNAISQSMQQMIDLLNEHKDEKDTETLQRFYDSVRERAKDIDNAEAKQKIIIELYDKFFKTAFPMMVEKLGIVYTPVEVVDYIIHSVDAVLRREFGRSLSDKNVHILDPFTGTGTFITRLLQSGLIQPEDLQRKYAHEIHANEIVLLAYYIASVNIENVYHDLIQEKSNEYTPFNGICLTDTFQLGETKEGEDLFSDMFPQNSHRVQEQQNTPLRIIMGNPPYSIGQKSENDNAQNQSYPKLDMRIEQTYSSASNAVTNKSLYDAYIKAFRWASDRLDPENGGVICFVSNGSWIDGNSTQGVRACLEKEFSAIYIFNLRGNQRTSGEISRKEGGKIFGVGSRTPISITLLIKKNGCQDKAVIYYRDIGDYLDRNEKLSIIKTMKSIESKVMNWQILVSNLSHDWINHRSDKFSDFIPLHSEKKFDLKTKSIFVTHSLGTITSRDAWACNFSKPFLLNNMEKTIDFYNLQVKTYNFLPPSQKPPVSDFIDMDSKKIAWSSSLIPKLERNIRVVFDTKNISPFLYRPFNRMYIYMNEHFIHRRGQFDQFFPTQHQQNLIICMSGVGSSKDFSLLITDNVADFQLLMNSQCFPLYWYEELDDTTAETLFDHVAGVETKQYVRRDAVSDFIFKLARKQYGEVTTKEDIFYYVYAFLHNPNYRTQFASDLKKSLPRIPFVDDSLTFWKYVEAGRRLAELHLNYESQPAPGCIVVVYDTISKRAIETSLKTGELNAINLHVEKMRFPKKDQKDRILYNNQIEIRNIPAEAYEYVVNGRSAVEWVMEQYQIKTHKESGIVNDPNDWADEHENPRYILNLLLSVMTVSIETMKIVKALPKVEL